MNVQSNNPFAPPASAPAAIVRKPATGFGWLIASGILTCFCFFVVAFVMIKFVPDIRLFRESQGLRPQPGFRWMIRIADFVILRWYVWPFVIAAAISVVKLVPANQKPIWRRRIGITISILVIAWAAGTVFVTSSALL